MCTTQFSVSYISASQLKKTDPSVTLCFQLLLSWKCLGYRKHEAEWTSILEMQLHVEMWLQSVATVWFEEPFPSFPATLLTPLWSACPSLTCVPVIYLWNSWICSPLQVAIYIKCYRSTPWVQCTGVQKLIYFASCVFRFPEAKLSAYQSDHNSMQLTLPCSQQFLLLLHQRLIMVSIYAQFLGLIH